VTLDLDEIRARHARRLSEFFRWKSDVYPEEYADLTALIAEVQRLGTRTDTAGLEEENRALRERVEALEAEMAWFRLDRMQRGG
jgi:hypothetical protein